MRRTTIPHRLKVVTQALTRLHDVRTAVAVFGDSVPVPSYVSNRFLPNQSVVLLSLLMRRVILLASVKLSLSPASISKQSCFLW